jgi:hypothetical protein
MGSMRYGNQKPPAPLDTTASVSSAYVTVTLNPARSQCLAHKPLQLKFDAFRERF